MTVPSQLLRVKNRIMVLLGDFHDPADDMGAVSPDPGQLFKLRSKQCLLKLGFQLIASRDAFPEPGELQFPLNCQEGFLSQVNQPAYFILAGYVIVGMS